MKHDTDARDTASDANSGEGEPVDRTLNESRRRFTRAGLSASVIMTLASRPALANHCSISAGMSGNLSRPHDTPCFGLPPGFWRNPNEWACGYEPGLCNPVSYSGGCKDWDFVTWGTLKANQATLVGKPAIRPGFANLFEDYKAWANWSDATPDGNLPAPSVPPTRFDDAFAGTSLVLGDSTTMMQVLWDPPADNNPQSLPAHATAALLNACRFGEESFGYTRNSLLQFINNWTGGNVLLRDALQALNERGGV